MKESVGIEVFRDEFEVYEKVESVEESKLVPSRDV
jgi:hypothetical protein